MKHRHAFPSTFLPARRVGLWILSALTALLLGSGCGGDKPPPVVVIGLDGADFDLLLPWLEAGELPNLAAFLDGAAVGELETVYPILSPVCWTSAVTGVNPGKHGIFDFQKMVPGSEEPIIETAEYRRALPIWMLLSDEGHRVAAVNVPMTYPPDPVRGVMISGFPFPSGDVNLTYPPELQQELGDYPIDYLGLTGTGRNTEQLFADFQHGMEVRGDIAVDYLRSGRYDFMWVVFTAPDKVQHLFWKYMEPDHPNYDAAEAERWGSGILDLWKAQDEVLGRMLAELPEDAVVLMLSDHGFDAIRRQVNLANWLLETDLDDLLDRYAIPPLLVTNGLLHYFVEGRLPGSADREEFLDHFTALLEAMQDPERGRSPIESVFRREDIYQGRMVEKAPDVVFQESPGYYVTSGSLESPLPPFQDLWSTGFSAYHRPHGILAVAGPMIETRTAGTLRERLDEGGDFREARILDVTPTLLALMDEIVPDVMDGRILEEVVSPEFLARHPVRIEPVEGFLLDPLPPAPLTDEEREAMKAVPYLQ
jgi:predicted AlkP superfamily phosphohydrolase/phosphomutase